MTSTLLHLSVHSTSIAANAPLSGKLYESFIRVYFGIFMISSVFLGFDRFFKYFVRFSFVTHKSSASAITQEILSILCSHTKFVVKSYV
jgi:hypothetical protein